MVSGMACLAAVVMNSWGSIQVFFVYFTKGPGGFPYVFLITTWVTTLVPVYGTTLVDHRVFVLGGDQEVLDGTATFEVGFVMDSGIVLKSLINVTALSRRHNSSYVINPTFILNLLTYLQVCTLKLYSSKSPPIESYIHIYMSLSHDCIKTLIGCFLIQIPSGTSLIYASPVHMHILLYITMTQLQSIVTVVH